MSEKTNSDNEYYGRDLVNVCIMSAKNNSDSEYYGGYVHQEKKQKMLALHMVLKPCARNSKQLMVLLYMV